MEGGLFFHSNRREGTVGSIDVAGRLDVQAGVSVNSLWIASLEMNPEFQQVEGNAGSQSWSSIAVNKGNCSVSLTLSSPRGFNLEHL